MVVQVRYYEYMYVIRDEKGERVYTGSDLKLARTVLGLLNGYHARKAKRKVLKKKRKVKRK